MDMFCYIKWGSRGYTFHGHVFLILAMLLTCKLTKCTGCGCSSLSLCRRNSSRSSWQQLRSVIFSSVSFSFAVAMFSMALLYSHFLTKKRIGC